MLWNQLTGTQGAHSAARASAVPHFCETSRRDEGLRMHPGLFSILGLGLLGLLALPPVRSVALTRVPVPCLSPESQLVPAHPVSRSPFLTPALPVPRSSLSFHVPRSSPPVTSSSLLTPR